MFIVQSRPPGIYKPGYLSELAERLNGGNTSEITAPPKPSWCAEHETESDSGGAKPSGSWKGGRDRQNDVSRSLCYGAY